MENGNHLRTELKLKIRGMTCEHCAGQIKKSVESQEGIKISIPDWQSGAATVVAETPDKDLAAHVIEGIESAGYEADVLDSPFSLESSTFDLAVLGTGGAGMAAAIRAAESGKRVAIIEKGVIGGTCVNIGCVPSKFLVRAAQKVHDARNPGFRGIEPGHVKINWPEIQAEKNELVASLRRDKYENVLRQYSEQITLIQGQASFTGAGTELTLSGGESVKAERVFIATGGRPRLPTAPGVDGVGLLSTTSLMELSELPESLVILGGRAAALELAQVFARFGVAVTVLQRSPRLLPDHEPEVSRGIREYLEAEGIHIHTGVSIDEFLPIAGGKKTVRVTVAGETRDFAAQEIVAAMGRLPNSEALNLKEAGVETNAAGHIIVDDGMRTSNPLVFAGGDVTTLPQFVYVAAASGGVAANNMNEYAPVADLDLSLMPQVIFTDPQIAVIGRTEAQARLKSDSVKTTLLELKHVPRALAAGDTRGFVKLVANSVTNTLIGASIMGAEGGELVQTLALAIRFGWEHGFTVEQFKSMLFPYLTQSEALKLAALTFDVDVSKLSCCAM